MGSTAKHGGDTRGLLSVRCRCPPIVSLLPSKAMQYKADNDSPPTTPRPSNQSGDKSTASLGQQADQSQNGTSPAPLTLRHETEPPERKLTQQASEQARYICKIHRQLASSIAIG